MGEAQRKAANLGRILRVDLAGPEYRIGKSDEEWLMRLTHGHVKARASRFFITALVNQAYAQGMDRKDGKIWATWLKVLDPEPEEIDRELDRISATVQMVSWLTAVVTREDLKIQAALAQWREALAVYLESISTSEPVPE